MRLLHLLMVFFFANTVSGQPTFNVLYDHDTGIDLSYFAVDDTVNKHYYITSKARTGGIDSLIIHKLDYSGNVLDKVTYSDSGFYWLPENLILIEDTLLVLTGSIYDPGKSDYNFFIGWYSIAREEFIVRYYPFGTGNEGAKKIKRLSDNGYIVVAFSQTFPNNDAQNYIFKVDSVGNKEWELIHGDSAHNEEPYDVIQLADSNLLGLSRRVYPDNDNILLLKLSPEGKLIWEKEIVSTFITIGSVIIPVNDSTVLVAGQGRNDNSPGKPFVQCFDTAGNPKWIKYYASGRGTFWHGDKVNDTTYVFAGALYRSFGKWDGYVVKTDQHGIEQWRRTISPYGEDNDPSNDYFYGVLSTSDGGILCTGFAGEGPVSNTQDGWIMKLDSEGLCDTPTCYPWLVTVIPNPERANVKIWPNPATELIQLLLPEPTGLISLHNLQGVLLLEQNVHSRRLHLAFSEVPAGLYLLHWTVDGKVRETSKVVIQDNW